MRLFVAILGLIGLQAIFACSNQAIYKQTAHACDSLNGALSLAKNQLLSTDSTLLKKAIARSKEYQDFISQHVGDTLSKSEADQLQKMLQSADKLQAFTENKYLLSERMSFVSSQLANLGADAEKKASAEEIIQGYYQREQLQVQLLLKYAAEQMSLYQTSLADFKSALPGVEALIRKRNRGELPQIIKDTLNL